MQISLLIRCFTPAPLQAISGHYFGLDDPVHTPGFGLKNFTWWNSHIAATVNAEKNKCLLVPCLNLLKGIDLKTAQNHWVNSFSSLEHSSNEAYMYICQFSLSALKIIFT